MLWLADRSLARAASASAVPGRMVACSSERMRRRLACSMTCSSFVCSSAKSAYLRAPHLAAIARTTSGCTISVASASSSSAGHPSEASTPAGQPSVLTGSELAMHAPYIGSCLRLSPCFLLSAHARWPAAPQFRSSASIAPYTSGYLLASSQHLSGTITF